MIQINLLPHREAARKKRREWFFVQLGMAAAAGLFIAGGVYTWYQAKLDIQEQRNSALRVEIKKLDEQIKEIASLQNELDGLKARQAGVESLQADRNLPVHLVNEVVRMLPDGVYLKSLKQDGLVVTLNGVAQSQERVSELLRNLNGQSPWMRQPQLLEIVAGNVLLTTRDQRRVYNFSLKVLLTRESEPGEEKPKSKKSGGKA